MKERISRFFFPKRWALRDDLDAANKEIARIQRAVDEIAAELVRINVQSGPEPPKKEVVHKPFRVNRVPGRKLRAELEWQNSPEFKRHQAQIREHAARQPQGEAHGR